MRERGATIAEGVKNAPEKNKLRLNIRIMALGLFGLQALVLMVLSYREYTHFGLTWDYGIFEQAFWMIAHGNLNPHLTVANVAFWRNHFELLMWPLSLLYWVWPNGPTLLFIQDLAAVGAEGFAFLITLKIVHGGTELVSKKWQTVLSMVALILLVMNPWTFWAESFDFHFHAIGACFITGALWAFYSDRRQLGYGLVVLTLLTSQVSTTYLVPAGAVIFLMNRRYRTDGTIVTLLGLGWFMFSEHMGVGGLGFVIGSHAAPVQSGTIQGLLVYLPKSARGLLGLMLHPLNLIQTIWNVRGNVGANLGVAGYVGLLSGWGFVPLLVIVETSLGGGPVFSQPSPSTSAIWALTLVGTVLWLHRAYIWRKWVGYAGLLLVAAVAIGWAFMGYQALPIKYTMASTDGARVLENALQRIPPSSEVVSSQGLMGRFVNRRSAYPFFDAPIPVNKRHVYFVVSPYQGINLLYNQAIASRMQYLATTLHATVMDHQDGIWIFRWTAPRGTTNLVWPSTDSRIMAWTVQSAVGHRIMQGSPSHWSVVANNSNAGYVLNGDYWRLPKGRYQASVSLQSSGPVNVEVWNDTGGVLLARRSLPWISGPQTLHVNFTVAHQYPRRIYSGIGPFRYQPVIPTLDNNIEVRVWTPGHDHVAVNWVGMQARK